MGRIRRQMTLGLAAGIAGAYAASAAIRRLKRGKRPVYRSTTLSRATYLGSGVTVIHER